MTIAAGRPQFAARLPLYPTSPHQNAETGAMVNRQREHLTPRAKAKRRRERIASVLLALIVIGCIAVTVFAKYQQ